MRLFGHRASIVRLPRLPRQVIVLALSINIAAIGLIIPYLVAEWVNRTLRETVAHAAVLTQLTDMQEMAMGDTQALRLVGYEVSAPDRAPQTSWLISPTPAEKPTITFDLQSRSMVDDVLRVVRILQSPGAPRDDELAEVTA